jgi:hypothetical protein
MTYALNAASSQDSNVSPTVEWGMTALDSRRRRSVSQVAAAAPRRHGWIESNRYFYGALGRLMRHVVEAGRRVLVLRSETGELLRAVDPSVGVGMEVAPEMIELAKSVNPQFRYLEGFPDGPDFDSHFGATEKFDYIIINQVNDLAQVETALENVAPLCERHSRILVYTYNSLWSPVVRIAERFKLKVHLDEQSWLSEADLTNMLHLSGFELLSTYRIVLMPKYIPVISDFLNRFVAKLPLINRLCMSVVLVARKIPQPVPASSVSVSVVVPCKDERGNVEDAVRRIPELGRSTEIIFCDDKSTDGTADEVRRMQQLYPNKNIKLLAGPGICKAKNVWTGFRGATGDILLILDADLTTMPEELPRFIDALLSGKAEFANGSRLVYPMPPAAMKAANMAGNKFFSLAFSYLLDQRVKDTLCGTKVLWRSDWERIERFLGTWGTEDRWGDYELLFGASKLNLRIVDIPVHYQERIYGVTKMTKVFKNGLIMLRMVYRGFLGLKLGY